jgi:hypothetical protein
MKLLEPICDLDRVVRAVADIMIFCLFSGVAVLWLDYFTGWVHG